MTVAKLGHGRLAAAVIVALALLLGLGGTLPWAWGADPPKAHEYDLKAVYLYNFLRFTTWPGKKAQDANLTGPRTVAILGDSPFGPALDALKDRGGIELAFLGPYRPGMTLGRAHLLFIAGSERASLERIVADVGWSPVLTVSDMEGFCARGGMIGLITVGDKVRWEINLRQIRQQGLTVSTQLLQSAERVLD